LGWPMHFVLHSACMNSWECPFYATSASRPSMRACATAWVRLRACSFDIILPIWRLTVLTSTISVAAMSALEAPCATRRSTSRSRDHLALGCSLGVRLYHGLDQVGRSLPGVCTQGMLHCLGGIALLLIPATCPQVQGAHVFPTHLLQPDAQDLGKEGMVAIPAALAIQGHHEDIG